MAALSIDMMLGKAEELGWGCRMDDDGSAEFYKFSPAGEDFFFDIFGVKSSEDLVANVREYADDFDPDEHIIMWVEAKRNGVGGVPSIRELVQDADDIDKMLDELASALEDALEGGF